MPGIYLRKREVNTGKQGRYSWKPPWGKKVPFCLHLHGHGQSNHLKVRRAPCMLLRLRLHSSRSYSFAYMGWALQVATWSFPRLTSHSGHILWFIIITSMIGGKTFVRLPSTNLFLAIKGGMGIHSISCCNNCQLQSTRDHLIFSGIFFLETFSGIRSVETWSPERTHPDLTAKGYM